MKAKIIKCEKCGNLIKSDNDIIYVEDQTIYFKIKLKKKEIFYKQIDSKSFESGNYLCKGCYSELPFQTEPEIIEYLKSIKK